MSWALLTNPAASMILSMIVLRGVMKGGKTTELSFMFVLSSKTRHLWMCLERIKMSL